MKIKRDGEDEETSDPFSVDTGLSPGTHTHSTERSVSSVDGSQVKDRWTSETRESKERFSSPRHGE